MANRKATMTDLRVIIREFAKGTPLREIERKLGLSRTSIRTYRERAEQSGRTMLELQSLEDARYSGARSAVGGDSDTIACMTGAIAGANGDIPEEWVKQCRDMLPPDLLDILDRFEEKTSR